MAKRTARPARDIEKDYPSKQFVAKLRRLADCIENGKRFQIQVAGQVHMREPRLAMTGSGHQFKHPGLETGERIAQHAARVAQPPGVTCVKGF